ncbi:cation diffusion facilitator family transporter [Desulforamulus ruminis]|uniref:Cation diffusion facilitator family transporter n=1 Tax=Desulforamulus ruminis (strain ATCC 23193 / DSM 2154 / NCIMB 8452 / DL) TaxID=696281 RepID=F6DRB5_DESRL|nr:cation diffusion facilitator family transporter [Desulforamulus ruminis]AEG60950.1 cation diffusion facilitator family transporter [Desulforamulus ruminis DSM 2154]
MAHSSEAAIKAALLANGVIMLMKLGGAILSGSASMMAEFKHSVGDWANGFFLLIGIRQSQRPVDDRYQFGHGKRVFFWSFIASLGMLFIGGALSIYGGIEKIIHPEHLKYIGLNLGIVGISILFECYSMYMAVKAIMQESGESARGISMFWRVFSVLAKATPATRFIFLEDTAALMGLILAGSAIILSVLTGNILFDGLASILIGMMLLLIGLATARENVAAILGEAADPALIRQVGDYVLALEGVKDVHSIRSMCIGPKKYLVELIIEANERLCLTECDRINQRVSRLLKEQFEEVAHALVSIISDNHMKDWAGKPVLP